MFVMGCYGHKLSNGVLFAHHLILGVPGGSSHLAYRRRVPPGHNPHTRVRGLNIQKYRFYACTVLDTTQSVLRDMTSHEYHRHA